MDVNFENNCDKLIFAIKNRFKISFDDVIVLPYYLIKINSNNSFILFGYNENSIVQKLITSESNISLSVKFECAIIQIFIEAELNRIYKDDYLIIEKSSCFKPLTTENINSDST